MRPKLILLVEDDVNLRQSIALILERAGYLVTTTDCADKASELLHQRNYNLLISDSNMSEIGTLMLPDVLANFPRLPVVILTDRSSTELENEKRLYDAHYLIKPVAPESLLEYVKAVLIKKELPDYTQNGGFPVNHHTYHQ